LREQAKAEHEEYEGLLTEYPITKDKTDMQRPQEPPLRMLIIPANNSAGGLFQILNDNKGIGLIFEAEGDTLAQTFRANTVIIPKCPLEFSWLIASICYFWISDGRH
jgi:hypothetical protein